MSREEPCDFVFDAEPQRGKILFDEVAPMVTEESLLRGFMKDSKSSLDRSIYVNYYAKQEEKVR